VHFWSTVCKTVCPMLSDRCLSCLSVTLVYCGQTVGCIKMPLGMEIGVGPGHIVLDGDPAPPKRGTAALSPIFGPCLLWPNGWMDRDATWYDGRPQPRQHCVRWGPSCPQKRARQPAHFGLCVLWSNSRPSQQVLSTCSVMFWMYCIIFQCRLSKLGI